MMLYNMLAINLMFSLFNIHKEGILFIVWLWRLDIQPSFADVKGDNVRLVS